jgi:hypothetical protein
VASTSLRFLLLCFSEGVVAEFGSCVVGIIGTIVIDDFLFWVACEFLVVGID